MTQPLKHLLNLCHGTSLTHSPLHTGLLAVLQEPSKLLSQAFACAVTSADTKLIHPLTSFRSLLKHHSSERLFPISLYEQRPPLLTLIPPPCSICFHATTSWRVSHNIPLRRMQALWGDISFGFFFFSVLVTAVSQHLEHNRPSGNICWRHKLKDT